MKEIILHSEKYPNRVALVDDEDYEWLNQYRWNIAVCHNVYYAQTVKSQGTIRMHRMILNPPLGLQVDHINHNGLDNRRSNLRVVTYSQNQQNRISRRGTSKYKGVARHEGKWQSYIIKNQVQIHLGTFDSEVKAAKRYNQKAREIFGEYALLNNV